MISGQLASIRHGIGINNPGIASVKAIPLQALTSTDIMQIMINESELGFTDTAVYQQLATQPGYNWLDLADDFPYPFEFKEDVTLSNHNSFFSYSLSQSIPHDDYSSLGQVLRTMDRHEWVLAIQQNNGQSRLIGYSNGRGAKLKDKYDSGKVGRSPSVHMISYTWESSERAIYLSDPSTQTFLILHGASFLASIEFSFEMLFSTLPQSVTITYVGYTTAVVTTANLMISISSGIAFDTSTELPSGQYWMQLSIITTRVPLYSNWVLLNIP